MSSFLNSPDRFIAPLSLEKNHTDMLCSDSCDQGTRCIPHSQHSQSLQRDMLRGVSSPNTSVFRGQTRNTSQQASPSKFIAQGFITPPSSPKRSATNGVTPELPIRDHPFYSPHARPSHQHSPVIPSTPINGSRLPPPRSPYSAVIAPLTSSDYEALYPCKYIDTPNKPDEGCTSSMVVFGADSTYAVAVADALYWSGYGPNPVLLCEEDEVVISAVCISREGKNYLIVGLSNGLIHPMKIYPRKGNNHRGSLHQTVLSLPTITDNVYRITALCVRNHVLISANAAGRLTFYDLQGGVCKCTYSVVVVDDTQHFLNSHQSHSCDLILNLDATSDGNHVAVATKKCLKVYHRYNMSKPTLMRVGETQPKDELCARSLAWCEGFNIDTGIAYAKGAQGSTLSLQSVGESILAEEDLGHMILLLVAGPTGTTLVVSHGDPVDNNYGGISPRESLRSLAGTLGVYSILFSEKKIRLLSKLVGHTGPILHAAVSVDGTTLVSDAGGDSILRFWEISSKVGGSSEYEDELR